MSKHGYRASVRITKIELSIGKHNARPYQHASIAMAGQTLECADLAYAQSATSYKPNKNLAHVYLELTDDPDERPDIDLDELAPRCIGQLEVSSSRPIQGSQNSTPPVTEIWADMYLLLPWSILGHLLQIRDSALWVEPVFHTAGENHTKTTVTTASGAIRTFVERVCFTPSSEGI